MSRRKRSAKPLKKVPWRQRVKRASLVSQANRFMRTVGKEHARNPKGMKLYPTSAKRSVHTMR